MKKTPYELEIGDSAPLNGVVTTVVTFAPHSTLSKPVYVVQAIVDAASASFVTPSDAERTLLEQITSLKAELERARELASWFRDEHTRTLPVVASFRRWRMGHQTSEEFHAHLRGDTCGKAISIGSVAPMQAMSELNDWCARKERS